MVSPKSSERVLGGYAQKTSDYRCNNRSEVTLPNGNKRLVDCGRCLPCGMKRREAWVGRMTLEGSVSASVSFLTLTYDPKHCPEELDIRGPQLFFKRLRKRIGPLRFFLAGEYGENTERAHWHAIIYLKKQFILWPQHVEQCWAQGFVQVRPLLSEKDYRYAAKYAHKAVYVTVGSKVPVYSMSRRPGIGVDMLRNMGAAYAVPTKSHPLQEWPTYYRGGQNRTYPFDRSARRWFKQGFFLAGGQATPEMMQEVHELFSKKIALTIIGEQNYKPTLYKSNELLSDLEVSVVRKFGDPYADPDAAIKLQRELMARQHKTKV